MPTVSAEWVKNFALNARSLSVKASVCLVKSFALEEASLQADLNISRDIFDAL